METDDLGTGTPMPEKILELKKEIERIVISICVENDLGEETFAEAITILSSLTELRFKKKLQASSPLDVLADAVAVPELFRCPISNRIMCDPVILDSGQTYNRPSIEKWLDDGNKTCPYTQKIVTELVLTPNILVQNIISSWCEETGTTDEHLDLISKPSCTVVDKFTSVNYRDYLNSLFDKMLVSHTERCVAVKELRQLTKTMPAIRKLLGESKRLLRQLVTRQAEKEAANDHDFQEDLITIILSVAIHEENKEVVAENKGVIRILCSVIDPDLESTSVAKRSAAAALFTLSTLHANKLDIGQSAALFAMINYLHKGDGMVIKDIVSAIISLCSLDDNVVDTIYGEAVQFIVNRIKEKMFVDELLPLLSVLSHHSNALKDLVRYKALPCLVQVISESRCEPTKEHAVSVLFNMCHHDLKHLNEIVKQPHGLDALRKLTESGTWKAKAKANGMLSCIGKDIELKYL